MAHRDLRVHTGGDGAEQAHSSKMATLAVSPSFRLQRAPSSRSALSKTSFRSKPSFRGSPRASPGASPRGPKHMQIRHQPADDGGNPLNRFLAFSPDGNTGGFSSPRASRASIAVPVDDPHLREREGAKRESGHRRQSRFASGGRRPTDFSHRQSTYAKRKSMAATDVGKTFLMDQGRFNASGAQQDDDEYLQGAEEEFEPRADGFYEARLPLEFVRNYVSDWVQRSNLGIDLLVYIFYLTFFCFFIYGEKDTEELYWTNHMARDVCLGNEISGFGWEITKTYGDTLNLEEWWQWFETVMVPNAFQGANAPAAQLFTMQGATYLLGAARLRTIIAANDSCVLDSNLFQSPKGARGAAPEDYPCHASSVHGGREETGLRYGIPNPLKTFSFSGQEEVNNTLYVHKACSATDGGQWIFAEYGFYHCGGYYVDIPFYKSQNEMKLMIDVFKDEAHPFFDAVGTRMGSFEFFLYTPSHSAFTSVKLFFELSSAGDFFPQHQFRSFYVWTSDGSNAQTVFDFFFFAFYLYTLYRFIIAWQLEAHLQRWYTYLLNGWNLLDLLLVGLMLTSFSLRWAWWAVSEKSEFTKIPFPNVYPTDLDNLLTIFSTMSNITSVCIVLTFLKMLKYMQIYPRLGILTLALSAKGVQLVSVLALFFWSVLAYAMAMWSLFGGELFDFRSFAESYSTLLRMLLGDFTLRFEDDLGMAEKHGSNGLYGAMRDSNRVLAGFFFWSYVTLVFFILLNMVIAVLAQGFSDVSSQYASSSFADDIKYACQKLKVLLSCARLKRMFRAWTRGASVTSALQSYLISLNEHERGIMGESRIPPGEVTITRVTFEKMMCRKDRKLMGKRLLDELWDDIVLEWQWAQLTPEAMKNEDLQEDVCVGINHTLAPIASWVDKTALDVYRLDVLAQQVSERLPSADDDGGGGGFGLAEYNFPASFQNDDGRSPAAPLEGLVITTPSTVSAASPQRFPQKPSVLQLKPAPADDAAAPVAPAGGRASSEGHDEGRTSVQAPEAVDSGLFMMESEEIDDPLAPAPQPAEATPSAASSLQPPRSLLSHDPHARGGHRLPSLTSASALSASQADAAGPPDGEGPPGTPPSPGTPADTATG